MVWRSFGANASEAAGMEWGRLEARVAAGMEWRSFGGKRRLQGWNVGCLEARGGFRDGLRIIRTRGRLYGYNDDRLEAR